VILQQLEDIKAPSLDKLAISTRASLVNPRRFVYRQIGSSTGRVGVLAARSAKKNGAGKTVDNRRS
jgi:hypothetical protein